MTTQQPPRLSRWPLEIKPLSASFCEELAPLVSEGDKIDLFAHGYEPLGALLDGVEAEGQAWQVRVDGKPAGAFGWTTEGSIWSMWTPMTYSQKAALLTLSPAFISSMSQDAGRVLYNFIWEGNLPTRKWLEATGCFEFDVDNPVVFDDRNFLPFWVKPDITERFPAYV
jgi:hypothetical protein